MKGLFLLLACVAVAAVMIVAAKRHPPGEPDPAAKGEAVAKHEGVRGPTTRTEVPAPVPTAWQIHGRGSTNRLAILLTDADSGWLGLAHGLKSVGVPFLITTNYQQALQHRVVMVYPVISGRLLTVPALQALAAHPHRGGTLIGVSVLGGGLEQLFGFTAAVPSKQHYEVMFNPRHSLTSGFNDSQERVIRIANPREPQAVAGGYTYTQPTETPLAIYEDQSAAVLYKQYGRGAACAFGFDPGYLVLLGHNNREEGLARSYVNRYEPTLDVVLRLLKNLYLAGADMPVTIGTVPFQRSLTVLLTHDVDYNRSLSNSVAFAELEAAAGVRATYFIQAKYVRDFNDTAFLNESGVPHVRRLRELGMEVASHSVSHSLQFADFPLGTGTELYPDYQPFVRTPLLTIGGSLLGELRVSKFLLERFGRQEVHSFRAGNLRNPTQLAQALAATGYRYSSSVTANNSLTHLPFRLNHDRRSLTETPIFEFPVTIEDQEKPPLGERLQPALDVAQKVAQYGGVLNVLVHPDILGHKLEFTRGLLATLREHAWFDTVAGFGSWWAARDALQLDAEASGSVAVVNLNAPQPIRGLAVQLPSGWKLQSIHPDTWRARAGKQAVIIEEASGSGRLVLVREN